MALMNRIETLTVNNPARAFVQRRVEAPLLLRKGGRMNGGTALELGCGRGEAARIILDLFGADRVLGIDFDPKQVERARARVGTSLAGRAEFRAGDAAKLDLPDASFDAVFEFGVLHHIPGWRAALCEVHRALRPGGRFYFEDLLRPLVLSRPFRLLFEHPPEAQFSSDELLAGVRHAGLDLVGRATVLGRAYIAGVAQKSLVIRYIAVQK